MDEFSADELEVKAVIDGLALSIEEQLINQCDDIYWPLTFITDPARISAFVENDLIDLIRGQIAIELPNFLTLFTNIVRLDDDDETLTWTSMAEITHSFSEAPQHWESLVARTCLRIAESQEIDLRTQSALSEIGHVLLFEVESMSETGYGYGWRAVDPDKHRFMDLPGGCTCGFPSRKTLPDSAGI